MKRLLIGLALVIAVAAGAAYWKRDDIAVSVFTQAVDRGLGTNTLASLPDGLHAAFCGTGSPLPDVTRAGPCTAVIAGHRLFVFDAGEGSSKKLMLMGFAATDVEAVFLTHFHSDHIDGLGSLTLNHWGQHGAHAPLPLYGGAGVERVAAGFNEAYTIDSTYRIAHHGTAILPPSGFGLAPHPFAIPEGQNSAVVLDDGGVRITAFNVNHGPVHPAFGYRVDYAGRSIVISGDTVPTPELVHQAENVDLLVHEALSPRLTNIMEAAARRNNQPGLAQIFHDILNYHTTPAQAAEEAEQAHAKALALTHIIPPLPISILEGPFLGDARSRYHGPLWIMHDGDLISLPRSGGVVRRQLLP